MAENRKPPQFPSEVTRRVVTIPGVSGQESLSSETNKKLVVGRDITLAGEITDCDILVVEGKVKASLNDSRRFEISESGVFEGNVVIEMAEIKGRFEGELTARGRLLVRRTGRVIGRIRYAELEIERGGQISGDVQAIAEEESEQHTEPGAVAAYAESGASTEERHLERESDLSA